VKVVVTGAGGQVGRALGDSVPSAVELIRYSHKELDIGDRDAVASCLQRVKPDVIVNAAAYTAVDRAESEPERARLINTAGPQHLAAAARECGARLLHISTDFVFNGRSSTPYVPESPTDPLGVYGLTKRDGEQAVLRALPERSVVLRTAWIYAAEGSNFVRTMLRVMRANGSARVVADQIGTPTAAVSLAQVLWKLAGDPQLSGIHHWTDAGVASWYDFAVAIAEEGAQLGLVSPQVTVVPISTSDYPTAARRPGYSVLDKSSLASLKLTPVHWRKRLRAVLGQIQHE
jgi:dTDP-4-dehydrorhamnose reductase